MSPRTEQELLDCVVDLAYRTGWKVHHDRPARTVHGWRTAVQGHVGFPDLVLAREGQVLFRELKGPKGRTTREQRDWGDELNGPYAECRARCHDGFHRELLPFDVWRPEDWDSEIVPLLTSRLRADSIPADIPGADHG